MNPEPKADFGRRRNALSDENWGETTTELMVSTMTIAPGNPPSVIRIRQARGVAFLAHRGTSPYVRINGKRAVTTSTKPDAERARDVDSASRVIDGVYVVGSLERGVTLYSQQIRAHNLVWALWEAKKHGGRELGNVAVVGGGAGGLTAAACLLALPSAGSPTSVTVFERLWDLCPLQQGSDARWLHPRIYDWPAEGSRFADATLPVLNWSGGRASDVARSLVVEFSDYVNAFAGQVPSLSVFLGLRNFQINAVSREISWVAHAANRTGPYWHLGRPEGGSTKFDTIILATGFGLETQQEKYPAPSYWRNEQLAQPILNGNQQQYLISGFGDGALVDLCRLTIERFRQDTIVYELFEPGLDLVEQHFTAKLADLRTDANVFQMLREAEQQGWLERAKQQLRDRIRKDTRVTLHMRGRKADVKTFEDIFGRNSSFLHRLITYLLHRCGAFAMDFGQLESAIAARGVSTPNVLCRYGADTMKNLESLFIDPEAVRARLENIKDNQSQSAARLWAPGVFRHYLAQ